MAEFKADFQSIDKDIERWMALYGTPDTLSNGTPVVRGHAKGAAIVIDLYFEHEAWDALIERFGGTTYDWTNWPELTRLNDALVERRDVRRLKRLWGGMIAEHKLRFWEYHAFCRRGRVEGSVESRFYEGEKSEAHLRSNKTELLRTVERAREIMAALGETDYARALGEDYDRIEKEERGKKLPKPVVRKIDEECFWELIDTARRNAGSDAEQMELLLASLETFKAGEINAFRKILAGKMDALYHWDVWALCALACDGSSDDMFEYFRAWLILQGRAVFETAVTDVERFADEAPRRWGHVEGLTSIADLAYENRSGKPLRPIKAKAPRLLGREWKEADLEQRFPRLSSSFQ